MVRWWAPVDRPRKLFCNSWAPSAALVVDGDHEICAVALLIFVGLFEAEVRVARHHL